MDKVNVGVRELKAKLSHYLATVTAGERVTVTDRGRPVAQLVPISGTANVNRGIDEGWIEAPRRDALHPPMFFDGNATIRQVLDDDRGS